MRHIFRRNPRLVYSVLLAVCIIGFWWFENFYTPDPYPSDSSEDLTEFPQAFFPQAAGTERVLHDHYVLAYAESHEQAAWVAYTLKREHLTYDDRDRPYFVEDPKVASHSADWRNYRGSGFDRGHLCPAGDRRFSETAYNQTFYTSNISPQDPSFNSGVWNELEIQVRRWCKRYGTLRVITGGILQPGLPSIGTERVSVPQYFFKVVIRGSGSDPEVIGFLMPNRPSDRPLREFAVPLDQIEAAGGLDFFPNWETERQHAVESVVRRGAWSF